jgi:sulfide:quinone oxidoreductase
MPDPLHVLVAGGGVVGLETLLALRDLAGDRVRCTLLTPEREFVYRPMAVGEPFARGRAMRHSLDEIARDLGAELVEGRLTGVDTEAAEVETGDGRIAFDALVIGVGAGAEPALPRVLTWTPESDDEVYGGLLRDLEEGYTKRVAFVVPVGAAWPLPAYELALMTAWQTRSMGHDDVQITIYTYEDAPLAIFGVAASEALRDDLEQAGVQVRTQAFVTAGDGRLTVEPAGLPLDAERIVGLPRAVGPNLAGVPNDERGFILCDVHGQVRGTTAVWAAGDAIAFPVKQGGLAAQQADAAVADILWRMGVEGPPRPPAPVLRGILRTSSGTLYLESDLGPGRPGEGCIASWTPLWPVPGRVASRWLASYLGSGFAGTADRHASGRSELAGAS